MTDEILNLRNEVHKHNLRFDLSAEFWKSHYVPKKEKGRSRVLTVREDGALKGYLVYSLYDYGKARAYEVRDVCADTEATLGNLIDQIVYTSEKDDVDFVFVRKCEEPHDYIFDIKGFSSLIESVIWVALLDPDKLLQQLSENVEQGEILKVNVDGFKPIIVKVGKSGLKVVKGEKSDLMISTSSKIFLKLFFGKTSVIKELLRRRITVDSALKLPTVLRFFDIIKQKPLYLPYGDWC